MKKCCFIIPYFGKFPNYFQLFLNSCKYNIDFNWLIFSDDVTNYNIPSNVRIVKMTFDSFKECIQSFFDFEIVLPTPYKLCDYKPVYGYVFHDYLSEYLFWGYCDLDVIMGNLNHFLTPDILENYDKIFCLGHMTLFRNTDENNRLFMSEYKGNLLYKKAFLTDKIVTFDEEWRDDNNINQIFLAEGKKVFLKDYSMNPSISYNSFVRNKYVGHIGCANSHGYQIEHSKDALYVWDKGHVYRYFNEGKNLVREEFIYMHFQMRRMQISDIILTKDRFKIIPNKFLPLEVDEINEDTFRYIKTKGLCFHTQQLRWKRLKKKLSRLIKHA